MAGNGELMKPFDPSKIRTYSLKDRTSKVHINELASPHRKGSSFKDFFSSLPNVLAARDFKDVATAIVQARKDGRPVMLGMGAHPIKVGLTPVIIDLMERGTLTSLSLNGAGIIHDFELAFVGQTSEDVDREILSGAFGMAEETGSMINNAVRDGNGKGLGIGESMGRLMQEHFTAGGTEETNRAGLSHLITAKSEILFSPQSTQRTRRKACSGLSDS